MKGEWGRESREKRESTGRGEKGGIISVRGRKKGRVKGKDGG